LTRWRHGTTIARRHPARSAVPAPDDDLPHPLELYRWAVQDPLTQARVLDRIHRSALPQAPAATHLREDFAGNCADSAAWIALGPEREALAVDLDASALEWGLQRTRRLLGESAARRLDVHAADVLDVAPPAVPSVHVLSALNFSLFYFHTREALRDYLAHARTCLDPQRGVLVANAFGGPGSLLARRDTQRIERDRPGHPGEIAPPPFDYEWDQGAHDALSGRAECRIHFHGLAGGRSLRDAFVYRWRLWTLPELVEIAREAGFARVEVWRHTYDASRGAAGVFLGPVSGIAGLDTWVAYLVAVP
jgi:hypothetical protein